MPEDNGYTASWSSSVINCPKCNNQISYYDQKKSAFFACPACGTFFEKGTYFSNALRSFNEEDRVRSAFPMGTQGTVDGKDYILVGYMRKKEADDEVYWNEYAFYTPGEEWYLMLAEYNGHWMIITRSPNQLFQLKQSPSGADFAYDDGWPYELYLSYKFKVIAAEGEFDWNILNDEELNTYEYVSAPNILVNEQSDQPSWFRAKYISPKDLMKQFNVLPEHLPSRGWPAPFNPATFYPRWKPLLSFSGILFALFVLVCVIVTVMKPSKQVFAGSFNCEQDTASWGNSKPVISPSFEIAGPSAVYFDLQSYSLDNNWVELAVALINDKDGKVYEVDKTIEYYHGYEDGETWDEGSRNQNAVLSNIPSGTYHLDIYPYTDFTGGNGTPGEVHSAAVGPSFEVAVTQNTFLTRNFWLMLLLIITYPIIQFTRKYMYENSKWFDKEYGTLNKG